MPGRDLVVIGASVGGVEALSRLVRGLPADFPGAVFIVCHVSAESPSLLPQILSDRGPLPVAHARDGERIRPGHIFVAPPNFHLALEPGVMRLHHGPRENGHRPAIDPLFRTAARAYGPRVVGVVLSGFLSDGAGGAIAIRHSGGIVLVQHPQDAQVADLPENARVLAGADQVLTVEAIARRLDELARQPFLPKGVFAMDEPLERMPERVADDMSKQQVNGKNGQISVFTCPECGGALWQVAENNLLRFRCHVGHTYYGENLLGEQACELEAALWTAVRIFRERTVLARQLAARETNAGKPEIAQRFEENAQLAERYGALIQEHLLKDPWSTAEPPSRN